MLLERVLARLRDEHVAAGKADLFDLLNGFLTGDSRTVTYGDVAKTSGMTEGAVKVAVHRLVDVFATRWSRGSQRPCRIPATSTPKSSIC